MITINKILFALALFGSTLQMRASSFEACPFEAAAQSVNVKKFYTLTFRFYFSLQKAMLETYGHEEANKILQSIVTELKDIMPPQPAHLEMLAEKIGLACHMHPPSDKWEMLSLTSNDYLIFISEHFPDATKIIENIQAIINPILEAHSSS